MPDTNSLKAYTVDDGDESTVIVFATSSVAARRIGASHLDCEFHSIDSCRRTKWADGYAPGPVPKLAMLDNGWWMECFGCGQRIDNDQYDDDDQPIVFQPVEYGDCVYCSQECRQRHLGDITRSRKVEMSTIEAMRSLVAERYPHAVIVSEHVYAPEKDGWPCVQQAIIRFLFPGAQYGGVELRFEQETSRYAHHHGGLSMRVSTGDQTAWRLWTAAGCPAKAAMPAFSAA